MASFASTTPVSFDKFTPEVDTQVYGQLLAKQDLDYQAGVQRVNQAIQSVASIPVVSEDDRQYVQNKVNNLTSNINRMVGTDYSDQKITGALAGHASVIYQDPNVQKIIANSSAIKHAFTQAEDDKEQSKGGNKDNYLKLTDDFNKYRYGKTVGTTTDVKYQPYTDVQKTLNTFWEGKHPNQLVRLEGDSFKVYEKNGPLTADDQEAVKNPLKWEAVKHTFKGIETDDAKAEIQNFVNTNPDVASQLGVHAYANYRGDVNGQKLYNDFRKNAFENHYDNLKLIGTYTKMLANLTPGTVDYARVANQIESLKHQTDDFAQGGEDVIRHKFINGLTSKEALTNLQTSLFTKNWIDNQARNKSYKEEDLTLYGMSPVEQDMARQRMQNEILTRQDMEKENTFKNNLATAQWELNKELIKAKIAKLNGTGPNGENFDTPAGIDMASQAKLGSHDQLQLSIANTDKMLARQKFDFMYSQLGSQAEKMFEDDKDGKVVPKKDYVKTIEDSYKQLYQRYLNGDKDLDPKVKQHFDNVSEDITQSDLLKQKNVRNEAAWNAYTKDNKDIVNLYNSINALDTNPHVISGPGINIPITGRDIQTVATIYKQVEPLLQSVRGVTETGGDPNKAKHFQQEANKILSSYGIDEGTYNMVRTYEADKLNKLLSLPETKSAFLNKRIEGSQLYTAQTARSMFNGNTTHDKAMKDNAATILGAQGIDSKTFENNNLNIIGTQDPQTGQYSVVLQDPTDASHNKVIQVDKNTADRLGLNTLVTTDPILKRIAANDDKGLAGNTGNPEQGGMTYANAFPTGQVDYVRDNKGNKIGNPLDLRYHVEHDPNGYYLSILGKDQVTKKEILVKKYPAMPFGKMKQTLNAAIGKTPTQAPAKYDPTIDNYTNSILFESTQTTQQ